MKEITLQKPLTVNGQAVDKIALNFEGITGRALLKAERDARSFGDNTPAMPFSMVYQALVAEAASGVKYDDLLDLAGADFTAVLSEVNGFLFARASEGKTT